MNNGTGYQHNLKPTLPTTSSSRNLNNLWTSILNIWSLFCAYLFHKDNNKIIWRFEINWDNLSGPFPSSEQPCTSSQLFDFCHNLSRKSDSNMFEFDRYPSPHDHLLFQINSNIYHGMHNSIYSTVSFYL